MTKSLDEEDDKNLSKDPKVVEIKRIFKVNEYLKVENKKNISSAKDMIGIVTDIFESIKNPLEIPKTIKKIVSKLI